MKSKILIILLGLFSSITIFAQASSLPKKQKKKALRIEEAYKVVQKMPRFCSEMCEDLNTETKRKECAKEALNSYIENNMRYPENLRKHHVEGFVKLRFVVYKDGSINEINIMKLASGEMNTEAYRLINEMPNWTPGEQQGRPVHVYQNLTINFKIK